MATNVRIGRRNLLSADRNFLFCHVKSFYFFLFQLLEIIQEYDYDQRRAFLQFVTGAPCLAHGGLAALNPKLTVVRKVRIHACSLGNALTLWCA